METQSGFKECLRDIVLRASQTAALGMVFMTALYNVSRFPPSPNYSIKDSKQGNVLEIHNTPFLAGRQYFLDRDRDGIYDQRIVIAMEDLLAEHLDGMSK